MKRITTIGVIFLGLISIVNFITPKFHFLLGRSIDNQITYLTNRFNDNLSVQLQIEFPEGELFGNLIFALSLIEYSSFDIKIQPKDIEKLIFNTTSYKSKSNFDEDLPLKYGAFYNGWINYTVKKYISSSLFEQSNKKSEINKLYNKLSTRIVNSQLDSINLLETYSNSIWPADNLVCIASLSSKHDTLKIKWLDKILLQSKEKLINHHISNINEIRGSSQALINYLLLDIDSAKAKENYCEYHKIFVDCYMSVSIVKEFEGNNQEGDIDSGPILLGYGSVATVMNNKLQSRLNLYSQTSTFGFLNTISFPINLFGKKFYLFGQEPMYDIFMLWNAVGLYNNSATTYSPHPPIN